MVLLIVVYPMNEYRFIEVAQEFPVNMDFLIVAEKRIVVGREKR